jgi:asparagine synthase (glutamine-hydrolysing)
MVPQVDRNGLTHSVVISKKRDRPANWGSALSGVFGVVDSKRSAQVSRLLAQMGSKMSHREWYVVDTYSDDSAGVGLGRMGIGILNAEPQPVLSRDGNIVLFLSGEFFDWKCTLAGNYPRRDQASSDAAYALQLYEMYGPQFAQYLAGTFAIAVYDRSRRIVLLITDRFGLYPLYFCQQNEYLVFAPEIKGVLQARNTSPQPDNVALAQYMRFQQVLGTRTFFQDVHMLAHASILTFDLATNSCHIEPYWSFDQIPSQSPGITFDEAAEETVRLMRLAVARRLRGNHRIGIYLSGGLDSRVILAAYPPEYPRPTTITYGLKNCRDVYYASQVAARANTTHHFYEFRDGKWVADYAGLHLTLTEGFHTWVHMHGINTLEMARGLLDINLTGFAGDQHLGGFREASIKLNRAVDELDYLTYLFERFNQDYNWPGISEAEEHVLYTPQTHARLAGVAFESLRQELQPYLRYNYGNRTDYFDFIQLDLRHYSHYITFTRSHLDVRHPYCDYDLVDFLLSLPIAFRENGRLEMAVLNRLDPSLALVPIEKDGFLPTEHRLIRNIHMVSQKAKRRFNKHIYPLFYERFTLPSDYERWLRGDLRNWAEAILFDDRMMNRGIFNPDFIRSIWARHQSGQEQWTLGKVAPIMTYEMMLQELVDA